MEEKLNLVNKKRVAILWDGYCLPRVAILWDEHCLPRVVFRRCKSQDLLPQYLACKALIFADTASIQENWIEYCHVVTEDKESALENFRMYSENEANMLPSIMVDLVLYSL